MYDDHVTFAMKCILTNGYLHSIHVKRALKEENAFSLRIHKHAVADHNSRLEKFLQNSHRKNQLVKFKLSFNDRSYREFAKEYQDKMYGPIEKTGRAVKVSMVHSFTKAY